MEQVEPSIAVFRIQFQLAPNRFASQCLGCAKRHQSVGRKDRHAAAEFTHAITQLDHGVINGVQVQRSEPRVFIPIMPLEQPRLAPEPGQLA